MTQEAINSYVEKANRDIGGYDMAKYCGVWHGYDAYVLGFKDGIPRYLGKPDFVLVTGDKIRYASIEECDSILCSHCLRNTTSDPRDDK